MTYKFNSLLPLKFKFPYKKNDKMLVFLGGKRMPRRAKKTLKKYYKERFLGKVRFKFSKPIDWKKVKTPKFIIQDDFGVF